MNLKKNLRGFGGSQFNGWYKNNDRPIKLGPHQTKKQFRNSSPKSGHPTG